MTIELIAMTPYPEKVIEQAGRTCYLSYDKMHEGSEKKFIRMLINSKHYSVLEHASATFRITGASRSFTHQLVRHRLCSYSQQSQRYVNEKNFEVITPPAIRENEKAHKIFTEFINKAKETYLELQKFGIKNEDARFVLPNAVESEIVITANFREWRHIIEIRNSIKSQWEIRTVVKEILKILKREAPAVFEDLEIWFAK